MDDRCRSGFALVKGFIRELTHVAEVTECVDLIELGCMCTSDVDRNLSANLLRRLRSTVPFLVLSRTPADVYHGALSLSKMKATIHIFYHKQAELSTLTDVQHQGRRGQPLCKSPSAIAATRGDIPLVKKEPTVPATRDSRYWPRPEDVHYDNKPGKGFNTRLGSPGAERFVEPAGHRPGYGSQSYGNSTHQVSRSLPIGRP